MPKWHRWTREEDARLKHLYNLRVQWRAIAAEFGVTVDQAQRQGLKLGILRKPTNQMVKQIKRTVAIDPDDWLFIEAYSKQTGLAPARLMRRWVSREVRALKQKQERHDG